MADSLMVVESKDWPECIRVSLHGGVSYIEEMPDRRQIERTLAFFGEEANERLAELGFFRMAQETPPRSPGDYWYYFRRHPDPEWVKQAKPVWHEGDPATETTIDAVRRIFGPNADSESSIASHRNEDGLWILYPCGRITRVEMIGNALLRCPIELAAAVQATAAKESHSNDQ